MIYRSFPQIHLNWVNRKKLSSDSPSLGVISESFRLISCYAASRSVGTLQQGYLSDFFVLMLDNLRLRGAMLNFGLPKQR